MTTRLLATLPLPGEQMPRVLCWSALAGWRPWSRGAARHPAGAGCALPEAVGMERLCLLSPCVQGYHQQYLSPSKNPNGYRCHSNTGVPFPADA
jgi:hypothetical protein